LRLRIGERFAEEARRKTSWSLDEETPFERTRTLDPKPSASILEEAKRNLIAAFPAFANLRVKETWGGLIDATPDAVPIIGEVPRLPGFFLATGFSGHGFGIGPGAGRLIADLVSGRTPMIDPKPFRLERFSRLERTTRV
jgi:glycine/D-amino acid oxidase-like deaminating enzyme